MYTYRSLYTLVVCFFLTVSAFSQNQNNQWRFGFNSAIDFNTSPPSFPSGTALPSVSLPLITGTQIEGTASVADKNTGALLLYTDGITVWNKLNQPMPNGSNLGGSDVLSSYNGTTIVPVPGSCTKYYIFCIDDYEEGSDGLTYSLVDMQLNNGLGDVVVGMKSVPLYDNNETELLMATPKTSGDGYWLISNGPNPASPTLACFEVTSQGVSSNPVFSPITNNGTGRLNYQGTKFVSTGQFDAQTGNCVGVEMHNFDAATGQFTTPITIPFITPDGDILQYFEFTFNGNYLYAGGNNSLYRFDLTSGVPATMGASATAIQIPNAIGPHGCLQHGPDGNLYYIVGSKVHRIENPNSPTPGPITELPSNVTPSYCLPQWIFLLPPSNDPQLLISFTGDSCLQTNQLFTVNDVTSVNSILWNFDDPASGSNNTSVSLAPGHIFSSLGSYEVRAIVSTDCAVDTLSFTVNITPCSVECEAFLDATSDTCLFSNVVFGLTTTSPIQSVSWSFGDLKSRSFNSADVPNPAHVFSDTGTYLVRCIVQMACGFDTVFYKVSVEQCNGSTESCRLYVPNAFSPNGDGLNDAFSASSDCDEIAYECIIFNRWGEVVFQTSNPSETWDGLYKGIDSPSGIYVYRIQRTLSSSATEVLYGSVSLMR